MMATPRRSLRTLLAPSALLLALGLAACDDDGTAPVGGEFDAAAAADGMASMVAAGDGVSDAFASIEAAGSLFLDPGLAAVVAAGPALDAESARRLAEGRRTAAFFPSNLLGTTFAYSDAEGRYVPTDLEGAPADGIRILYYAVDPITKEPQADVQLGYIDLRDLSGAASNRLGVRVVNDAGDALVTLADYYIDASWTLEVGMVGAELESVGYVSDGESRLDFDLSNAVLLSETQVSFTQDYAMGLAGSDLSVHYVGALVGVPGSEEDGSLTMLATVTNEGQEVVFDVTATAGALDGTIAYGSGGSTSLVATIGGTPDAPVFTDAGGNQVDPAELEALRVIFQALNALFEVAEGIFGPAQ